MIVTPHAGAGVGSIGVTMRPAVKALVRRLVPFPLRRAVWRVRRNVPRVAQPLSLAVPRTQAPERPIFVIGCPRAGTSALLQLLLRSPELRSIHNEGHILWDCYHHPKDRDWDSDALGAEDVTERERAYIYLAVRMFVRNRRFVDKTAENCLRIPYLGELFPGATFLFLRRRAAGNVNSLIEAWKARPRFVKYRLPEPLEGLGEMSGNRWSFALIPGWRQLRSARLEEICARQYIANNEAALDAREGVDPSRWLEVAYEDLVASPVADGGEALRWPRPRLRPRDRAVCGHLRQSAFVHDPERADARQVEAAEPRADRAHSPAHGADREAPGLWAVVKLRRQRSVLVCRGPKEGLGPAPAPQSLQSAPPPQPLAGAEVEREGRRPVGCDRLALAPDHGCDLNDAVRDQRGPDLVPPDLRPGICTAVSERAAEGLRDRPVVGSAVE